MEKKDLLKKQELAEELGMKFDEASELFSGETLETMRMMNVVGGEGDVTNNCQGGHCGNCVAGCESAKSENCDDKSKRGDCRDKYGICDTTVKIHKCGTDSPGDTNPSGGPWEPLLPLPTNPYA